MTRVLAFASVALLAATPALAQMGGPPQKVTNYSDLVISRFAASPDGQSIALCRGVVARDAFIVSNFR